jgi:hypothetical protein
MDDKTLLQNLINEIKNLNARGVSDSKVLRDSLSQDALISKGITDLNKQFEKSSKDNKQTLDESKSLLEQIRDEIKNNSGGGNGGGSIAQSGNIRDLSTLFFRMINSTKDLIAINTKLNKNITDLIQSNNGLSGKVSRTYNINQPSTSALSPAQQSANTSSPTIALASQSKFDEYQRATSALGSFFNAINSFKVLPAFKASLFMPLIINNFVKAMQRFDKADVFGKMRTTSSKTKIGKKIVEETFDYSSNIFESIQKLADSLNVIQNIKMAKTWVQVKLLSMFIIPSMIKAISKFDGIKSSTTKNIVRIAESIDKFLSPITKFMGSFLKMGLGLIAIAGGIVALTGAAYLVSKIDTAALLKGGIAIGTFLTTAILSSSIAGKANKTSMALIVLGAAMIPFAYGLSLLKDVGIGQIVAAGASIVGLIFALSKGGEALATNPKALLGLGLITASIAGIGWSMKMLGEAANLFNAIDPMNLLKVAGAMLGLSLSILPLVPFAPFVGILSLSMAVLAATLMGLSKVGLHLEPVTNFFNDFKSFIKEIEISKILGLSAAIGTLGLAISAFAASNFAIGISDAFSGIIGFFTGEKSIIEKLKELSTLTSLSAIGMGVKDLAEGMNMLAQIQSGSFAGFNEFPWDKIREISKELEDGATLQIIPVLNANSLNGQKLETTGATMTGGNQVIITNVTNTGGNVSTTNVSNNNRNVRVAPSIETGSARGY